MHKKIIVVLQAPLLATLNSWHKKSHIFCGPCGLLERTSLTNIILHLSLSLFKCQLLFIFLTIYTKEVFKIRHIQNLFLQKFSLLQPLLLSLSLFRIHTNIFLLYFYFYLHLQIPYLHLLSYIHMPS